MLTSGPGGYDVPPATITGTPRNDIMFIEEVIGAGEIAISDGRSTDHNPRELSRLVIDTHNGGMLADKAGVTHFHVGEEETRLEPLKTLINDFPVKPEWLYPTHITRSERLMKEAIGLTKKGTTVDIDTVQEDLSKWLKFYFEHGGLPEKLTFSTDASITSPQHLIEQMRDCVLKHKFPLEQVLRLVTANTAKVLNLKTKGTIEVGKAADLLVLRKKDLELKDVFASGQRLVKNGRLNFKEKFLKESDRRIELKGNEK
jgi:beta-aspartyl-dipeptidase (metallo-type)